VAGCLLAGVITTAAGAHEPLRHNVGQPTIRIDVFGDSTAVSLAWGLAAKPLAARYGYTLKNMGDLGCGVVDGPAVRFMGTYYSARTECNGAPPPLGAPLSTQPWPNQWQAALAADHPSVAVVLAGRWEIVDRVYDGAWTNILQPAFAQYAKRQLELASSLITSTGANVVFMTAPCANEGKGPDGVPYPESDPRRLAVYNRLVRQVVAEHPKTDKLIDLDAIVCPEGRFAANYRGVKIRTVDGIHFTQLAGVVLGPALMPAVVDWGRAELARVQKTARS
jgi:hypothetical protein